MFIAVITVIGASGIVAQVMLLRELLVAFSGNELTLGLMLASWLICEVAGVATAGFCFARRSRGALLLAFVALEVLFLVGFFVSLYLARSFRTMLGFSFGEVAGPAVAFTVSLAVFLPLGFCHGALFSASCGLVGSKEGARAIGRVYAWETLGTIAGALLLTFALIQRFNPFEIAFIVAAANISIMFCMPWPRRGFAYAAVCLCLALIVCLWQLGVPKRLQQDSVSIQWRGLSVLEWRNSVYGNIVVAQRDGQHTFFYNGTPLITLPHPDDVFVQEFGNLPLLFHSSPDKVLLVASGAGGLLSEVLKHPVGKVDYAELDPMLILMLRRHPSETISREFGDPRVNVTAQDGRLFVATGTTSYDVILLGAPPPMELSMNRFFTQEFFWLAKKRLSAEGLFACWLPGSSGYLSRELIELNASVLNALRRSFGYVRVIPGDYNIFIASDSGFVEAVSWQHIIQRLKERRIIAPLLLPDYLKYRLQEERVQWFQRLMSRDNSVNYDFQPRAVFASVALWVRQFSPTSSVLLQAAKGLNLGTALLLVLFCAFVAWGFCLKSRRRKEVSLIYGVFASGFFGMLLSLILIFGYQAAHGYLYHKIGLLVAAFMSGIACGSMVMNGCLPGVRKAFLLFLEVCTAIYSLAVALAIARLSGPGYQAFLFCAGFFLGLEFPLASRLYPQEKGVAKQAGILYAADLLGGCAGGIAGALVLVPVLGLTKTCVALAALKATSALLLWKNL